VNCSAYMRKSTTRTQTNDRVVGHAGGYLVPHVLQHQWKMIAWLQFLLLYGRQTR
jgi:hypothetical protein